MNEIQQAARLLIERHGGLRAAARAVTIDHAYLSRLASGDKCSPGENVLRKLGLVKSVTYSRGNGKARK